MKYLSVFRWTVSVFLFGSMTAIGVAADLEQMEQQAIRAAVDRVAPSVVRVQPIGGLERVGRAVVATGATSGVIVDADGWIISSNYAFVQQPTSVLVTLYDGKRLAARIVAHDRSRKLVLLKVDSPKPLPVAMPAPRKELAVGQWAVAVGRSLATNRPNVSIGIVSALQRIWGKAVQTDAKVSYVNYGGPLVDIRGRVIGILVPMSPNQQTESAGAEWYDSGIGFAVPLEDVLSRLDQLRRGVELTPGLLGVSMKGTNIYALSAIIALIPPKSPARAAGLRAGDTIVEVDGMKIERQAQLRHALGPHVAGDKVRVVVLRGKEKTRIEANIELVAQVDPYVRPFLGILPMRDSGTAGVRVRFVYPQSPAATAGVKTNDLVVALAGKKTPDVETLRDAVAERDPDDTVKMEVVRDGKPKTVQVTLRKQPTGIPADLPAAHAAVPAKPATATQTGIVDIKIPEEPNACVAYVPDNYDSGRRYGLLVWLPAPGKLDQEVLQERWQDLCATNDLIVLVPQARDSKRWSILEVEFIQKVVDDAVQRFSVDKNRIVVHGYQVGGAMAYLAAFANRDLVRGVAVVDAGLPQRVAAATTDPYQPLSIYSLAFEKAPTRPLIEAGQRRLEKAAFNVVPELLTGASRYLNADELVKLVRWIDTLDRI